MEPCILAPLDWCGLEVMPDPSSAHRTNVASSASASVTSAAGSDVVVESSGVATSTSEEKSSSNQVRSLHSSFSGGNNKTTERGPLLVSSLLSGSGRRSRGRGGENEDHPTHTASEDDMSEGEMSENAHQPDTIRPPRENSEDVSAGARDRYSLTSASGGHKPRRKKGGPPADRAQRGGGRANHRGSSTTRSRRNFVVRVRVRAGIGTAASGQAGSNDAPDLDGRSYFSGASADNGEDGTAAAAAAVRSKDGAETFKGATCSPAASPTTTAVADPPWSGYEAVPPDGALPFRRAKPSANVSARRAAQCLASDTMSLRARRRTESRDAGQLRQEVFKSLGVGSKRTIRTVTDGKGRQVVLVKVSPPP